MLKFFTYYANQIKVKQLKRPKATWTDSTTRIFREACAEEVHAGNRPNTHLNKIG